jgi:2-polyprenyl-3-methyl-5-hydroxy-6-metoxy-1,4-benzoquinol methylase
MSTAKPQDYFSNVRRDIDPLLPRHVRSVLEVGCGTGATLAWLKATGRCGFAAGIELSEDAAAAARQTADRIVVGNAEQLIGSTFAVGTFDAILCLDVLEHLVDPWSFVRRIEELLAPGGTFIASIPNVRHIRVVVPLILFGRWRYEGSGLLDRTHLRFFTQASAVELMSSGALRVSRCVRRINRRSRMVNMVTLGLFRDLLTSQYLIASMKGQ